MRAIIILTTIFIFLFYSPLVKSVFAGDVAINEFVSDTSGTLVDPDWVEIYNSGASPIDLSEYRLEDLNATNKKTLSGTIEPSSFATFDWSNKLNKAGDVVSLVKISESLMVDRVSYGDQGSDVSAPGQSQSAGRTSDGTGGWTIFSVSTKGSTNNTSSPDPTATPTPVPTNTPTPTLTAAPTKTPTPTPKPTNTPTPTKIPTPTKTPTPTPIPKIPNTPTSKPSVFPTSKILPTSVLGESTESASIISPTNAKLNKKNILISNESKNANNNFQKISIFLGIIFISVCAILTFQTIKKGRLTHNEEK